MADLGFWEGTVETAPSALQSVNRDYSSVRQISLVRYSSQHAEASRLMGLEPRRVQGTGKAGQLAKMYPTTTSRYIDD